MNGLKMLPEYPANGLVLIVGPTAVGKTRFAITLAQEINGEIISADSRSFYRGMDIGTAKPTKEEQARVPHHLVNIAEPDETISLNLFLKLVHSTIKGVHSRGKIPILVGGTGQYMRSILDGWQIPEGEPDKTLRLVLESLGKAEGESRFHEQLAVLDKDAALTIDPKNQRRVVRAMEVIFTTGRKFSEQKTRTGSTYSNLVIGLTLPRDVLYARVDARIEQMVKAGLESETRSLVEKGYNWDLPSMSAIGYKEMGMMIRGEITEKEAIALMKKRTRIFIRRQAAWFKPDDIGIHWFDADREILQSVENLLSNDASWSLRS
jgi:tRNA dimethylallyltransferase